MRPPIKKKTGGKPNSWFWCTEVAENSGVPSLSFPVPIMSTIIDCWCPLI